MATAQIVWPLPFPCGDQVLTSNILASLNQLAPPPPGGICSFHNKCGIWFFTASLTPEQIQQLMGENVGIEFIEPNEDAKNDIESLSNDVRKRLWPPNFENPDRESVARPSWRAKKKRALPDFIQVTSNSPLHLAYISTPPGYTNPNNVYASFDSAGDSVHIYWIDSNFNPENDDLESYRMSQHQLMAEDIDLSGDSGLMDENARQLDHGGCMLSIIGGTGFGVLHRQDERTNGVQLVFVKENELVSSFLSRLQAIISEFERRSKNGDIFIHAYTVIGTSLVVRRALPGVQNKAAELFKKLIHLFGVVIVVAAENNRNTETGRPVPLVPRDIWPASFSLNPETPLIVAGAILLYTGTNLSPTVSNNDNGNGNGISPPLFPMLRALSEATCQHGQVVASIIGISPPTAIITGLAANMLSRPKVRTKIYLDFPDQEQEPEPEPEKLLMHDRPVAAKIRDYPDQKSHDRRGGRLRVNGVWNGLDQRDLNIANYEA